MTRAAGNSNPPGKGQRRLSNRNESTIEQQRTIPESTDKAHQKRAFTEDPRHGMAPSNSLPNVAWGNWKLSTNNFIKALGTRQFQGGKSKTCPGLSQHRQLFSQLRAEN
jgi:hypothetical protein